MIFHMHSISSNERHLWLTFRKEHKKPIGTPDRFFYFRKKLDNYGIKGLQPFRWNEFPHDGPLVTPNEAPMENFSLTL